jgi:hypothetical protein
MHWRDGVSTAPWSSASILALANACYSRWSSTWLSNIANNLKLDQVLTVDIGSATPAAGATTGPPLTGTAPAALEPSSLCDVVQYKINARYRGGHPRGYWPFATMSNLVNESTFTPAHITFVQTTFQTFVNNIANDLITSGSIAPNHCVPRYTYAYTNDPIHHKYVKTRTGLLQVLTVSGYVVRPTVGSQRRRLTL